MMCRRYLRSLARISGTSTRIVQAWCAVIAMIVAKLIAVLVAASPLPDTEYEEILPHRSTLHGSPMGDFFGWGELPFAGPIEQVVGIKGGGAMLRTASEGLWISTDDNATKWSQVQRVQGDNDLILLDGAGNAMSHAGTVSTIECSNSGRCHITKVAQLDDPSCASTVRSGWLDANSGQIIIGCATGAYLGVASASNPPSLVREPTVQPDGGVIAVSGWKSHLVAATSQRLYWKRADGTWWWEWISQGDSAVCGKIYSGGVVEGVPTALIFDAAHGNAGGIWVGHSSGLQVVDLYTGALQRFDPIADGLPVANITALAVAPRTSAVYGSGPVCG